MKKFYVIGNPIDHSMSPTVHNYWFKKNSINAVYEKRLTEKNEIEKIILIKVPSQIYKELRKIFVSLFEYSGFKDIKINENVDFEKLYNMRKIQ